MKLSNIKNKLQNEVQYKANQTTQNSLQKSQFISKVRVWEVIKTC